MKQLFILLFLTLSFSGAIAQENEKFNFTFNHLALSVKDLQKSTEFYSKILQLKEITNRTKMEGIRWFSLGEGKELHLVSTLKEEVKINKAVHLALTSNRFDEFVQTLEQFKIPYSDWPGKPQTVNLRADGVKQIYLQDPDGYWIEINSVGAGN